VTSDGWSTGCSSSRGPILSLMPHFELDLAETRILGCLLEKERLTPENYPISLNGLTAACNQSTNRDPVLTLEERVVEAGIIGLREKRLATMIHSSGARVQKYRHNLPDHYDLQPREVALLCVLLLRGPQTPGELRARTERMAAYPSIEAVESALRDLAGGDDPLVRMLPARPGQKENRYVQLLSGEPVEPPPGESQVTIGAPRSSRTEAIESELAALRAELQQLREEFASFRKQFE
jgi:uncharacterized protein